MERHLIHTHSLKHQQLAVLKDEVLLSLQPFQSKCNLAQGTTCRIQPAIYIYTCQSQKKGARDRCSITFLMSIIGSKYFRQVQHECEL